jgi:NAD(P)-dependent dehydrogenase (short-subunit alcohol dehydrogenase family)
MRLQDRIAIVTGAGAGIGKAIALGLAREGAKVVVNDVNQVNGQATAQEIQEKYKENPFSFLEM